MHASVLHTNKMLRLLEIWMFSIFVVMAAELVEDELCSEQTTCGACISAAGHCGWCMDPANRTTVISRCDALHNLVANGCNPKYIVNITNSIEMIKNDPPRDPHIHQNIEAIQLSPQQIHVHLRPNTPQTLDVTFRLADNYPVDLYYLMDLSNSMKDDLAKLTKLADTLAKEMLKISNDFRLGFGSFVDKKTYPYVSVEEDKLIVPKEGAAAPYSFQHHMNLTSDLDKFASEVKATNVSANLDPPEGTFDAMMQVVMCENEIGWRKESRKILLVTTDHYYHMAGDGKLGGIVTPNDGACHLKENMYSHALNQDYPSIFHLAHHIAEKKINVIFAVTESRLDRFKMLSNYMEGSVVGILNKTSANVVTLIKQSYKEISGRVELKAEVPKGINLHFRTKCYGEQWLDIPSCDDLGLGQQVKFSVTLEAVECPTDPSELNKVITVSPVGLTEKLTINTTLICSCPCQSDEFPGIGNITAPNPDDARCSGQGTYECAVCSCNPGHYGEKCECDESGEGDVGEGEACQRTNRSAICEGRGSCQCGQCVCGPIQLSDPSKTYSGKYCECNNYACDVLDGKICGGPDRGTCRCGKCQCKPGYEGKSCSCLTSNSPCVATNNLICNDKGRCKCGRCECEQNYRGPTCEDCPTCPGQCDSSRACVQCRLFKTGPLSQEDCASRCEHITPVIELDKEEKPGVHNCKFRDEDGCDFFFTVHYDKEKIYVRAQEKKECPGPVDPLPIILGVIGGVVAIGIVLLIVWKIVTTIFDKRELAKFYRERERAQWQTESNPLFKPPTSTFQNPTYRD